MAYQRSLCLNQLWRRRHSGWRLAKAKAAGAAISWLMWRNQYQRKYLQ